MKKITFLVLFFILVTFSLKAEEIHKAAKSGNLEILQKILKEDPSKLNTPDKDLNTPLHLAIKENQIKTATFLLKNKALIDPLNSKKETPLHLAAFAGNSKAIKLLLKHGASVKLRDMRFRIPLFMATNWGNDLESVKLLVQAGSDINDRNKRNEIILVSTLAYGKNEIINYLIDRGATLPNEENILSRVIFLSVANGRTKPFLMAKKQMAKLKLDWTRQISMHTCARGGSLEIAKLLLAKNFDFSKKNVYGIAPIHIAAEQGNLDIVKLLLKKGVDINEPSYAGKMPIHFARENKHQEIEDYLKEKKALDETPKFPVLKGKYLEQKLPGEKPQRFASGIVSTHGFNSEHSPAVFSPKGDEVFWTKKFRGPVLFSKQIKGIWSAPQEAPFMSEYGEGEPVFSPDGQRLYFLSLRPIQSGSKPGKENIWFVNRTTKGWSKARPVGKAINDCPLHWSFSVAANGNLYFPSVLDGGFGAQDIYCSEFKNGKYQKPKNMGPNFNHKGIEHTPYIAPDESYLIYVSTQGAASFGSAKFHISFKSPTGQWSKPVKCSKELNKFPLGLCPQVTPDQKYMFFIGNGDIYWVKADFIEKLRPKK